MIPPTIAWMMSLVYAGMLGLGRADLVQLNWNVQEGLITPGLDQVNGILINGQFPGPAVRAKSQDTLEIRVSNLLNRPFTIHWHGLTMTNTPESDGVPNLTQRPIMPNQSYLYRFHVGDQSGTFWYHAHTGMDGELAYGSLVVQDDSAVWQEVVAYNQSYQFDDEATLVLSELWSRDAQDILHDLVNVPFRSPGLPSSILINGKDHRNGGGETLNLKPNKRYRLRIIGANGHSILKLKIPGHKLTVIEADGTLVQPIVVDELDVNAGQRYSVILTTDAQIGSYPIYVTMTEENSQLMGLANLSYEGAQPTIQHNHQIPPDQGAKLPADYSQLRRFEDSLRTSPWYLRDPTKHHHFYELPKRVTKQFVFDIRSAKLNGLPIFTVNGVHPSSQKHGVLDSLKVGHRAGGKGIYDYTEGDVVQLVMQQFPKDNGKCVQHPWHLHGHSFYIVGYGKGLFNPRTDPEKIQQALDSQKREDIPILRDTFTHYPIETKPANSTGNGEEEEHNCGWVALRFKANNPGSWYMHCHITYHLVMGKSIIFNERPKPAPQPGA